jgi:peptidoglycan-associated lipoprotein
MNLRRWVWLTTIVLVVVLTVTACAKKIPPPPPPPPPAPPAAPAPPPPPPPPPPAPPAPAPAPPRPLTEDEVFSRKTLEELNAERPLSDVSFDYDMAMIRDDQRAILQKNADYLRRWTTVRVTIEGHADSRGTNEYNLALGERRGNTVKDYLAGLGIGAERLVVISKGEESPLCTEETEACFARNRRGHFIITAK